MRLIDADKLKDTLLEHNYTTEHNQIFCYISEQPTAYDIDKAVEELKESVTTKSGLMLGLIEYETVLKIVKQGGVADDVCEWKFEETNGIA